LIKWKYIGISVLIAIGLVGVYRGVGYLYTNHELKKILSTKDTSLYEYDRVEDTINTVLTSYIVKSVDLESTKARVRGKVSDKVYNELFPQERVGDSFFTSYELTNFGIYEKKGVYHVLIDVIFKNDVNSYDVRMYMTIKNGIVIDLLSMGMKNNEL